MPKGRKPISKKDAATANAYYTFAAAKGGKDLKKRVDTGPDRSKKIASPGSPLPEKPKPAPARSPSPTKVQLNPKFDPWRRTEREEEKMNKKK